MCAHAGHPRSLPAECGVRGSSPSAIQSEGLDDIILENGTYQREVSQGLTLATWVVAGPKGGALGGTAWLRGTENFGDCLGSSHVCHLLLCALRQVPYPLCACVLSGIIGIMVVPTSQCRCEG